MKKNSSTTSLPTFFVEDFFQRYQLYLSLQLMDANEGMKKPISWPEVHFPGLSLTGYLKELIRDRLMIFGNVELLYLRDLDGTVRKKRLDDILASETPAIIVSGKEEIPEELVHSCKEKKISLFRSELATMELINKMTMVLSDEFSTTATYHGTFIEAFGIGLLIQGDSSIGKSEAALGLIERGHRLISDDVVRFKVKKNSHLEGSGPELTRHIMEIRGIGIINVAHLFGAVCVRDSKRLDIIVKLEEWNSSTFYDRIGLDEKYISILGLNVPYHVLPIKPGRDIVLLLEILVLNYRLKLMGYHSAKEFNRKILETILKKQKEKKRMHRT
ncbi:MAG: HPr(Ser) kinase/phosphatase [Chlamydiae bacterium]|nr:HPr(Ser) kinase/phosphatase [Chlamydiota bacterium]